MGKTPDQATIIEHFFEDPHNAELREVMPLVPRHEVMRVIQEQYGIVTGNTHSFDYEHLAIVIEGCEALRGSGLDPAEYDYNTWFLEAQDSLDGLSPRRLLIAGDAKRFTEFVERTVALAKQFG
jgi:hypothetical protein